ncbi:DNA-binding transcriptional regulator, XRE-family HTH domain [Streptococcus henryi]|uniref:DNA-binding transcriptional regulator, XRE-family HTH domain n=1 Tax=Streptococcus henryi TaxID=439219 RepID=A0A1G6DIB8_9STRE|nr:DNA-binding transcriptional regulator, XRE-family HTH domain [Streptococcus henryi]
MEHYIIQNFGPNLKRLRQKAGLSQTDLAKELGIGKQSLSDYEKQKSYPTFTNLDKIARFFQVNSSQLFGTIKESVVEDRSSDLEKLMDEFCELLEKRLKQSTKS